ncbi:MAG: ABC transporter permease [Phycisphaerales bacterium]
MTFGERLLRIDNIQRSQFFKIAASCVVVAIGLVAVIAYAVRINVPEPGVQGDPASAPSSESARTPDAGSPTEPADGEVGADSAEKQMREVMKSNEEATARIIDDVLSARQDWGGVATGAAAAVALALTVIWLGLGLTYLGVIVAGSLVIVPLSLFGSTRTVAVLAGGLVALTLAFSALLRVLNLALSAPHPILAVARNTVAEAVRMKVGLIFIVLLIFGLAALPMMLDAEQPLRYRVQSFLQYSVGGSFWMVALLVLTFATASVCFEQRDKVLWQTITKPVSHAQYLLGKWLGVTGLAAVLMLTCGAAIFMFTEYLRDQRALGERSAYVAAEGGGLTDDRKVLEMQVLTARLTVPVSEPEVDEEQFKKNLDQRVQQEIEYHRQLDDSTSELRFQQEHDIRQKLATELRKSIGVVYRSIAPGGERIYRFEGLADAKRQNRPIILRFKINAGANMPDQLYHLTLQFPNNMPFVQTIGLSQFHTVELLPTVVDENGLLELRVQNGDVFRGRSNPETMTFANDGLEVTYSVGGYRMNYIRVMLVLWVKLGFLAMLAICAATGLSFPVASLVAFTSFLAAEGASFLHEALQVYQTEDDKGKMMLIPTVISKVAELVSTLFGIYADLKPVPRLVGGLWLSWQDVFGGTAVLALMTVILYVGAVLVFKRRELATYSGQ